MTLWVRYAGPRGVFRPSNLNLGGIYAFRLVTKKPLLNEDIRKDLSFERSFLT